MIRWIDMLESEKRRMGTMTLPTIPAVRIEYLILTEDPIPTIRRRLYANLYKLFQEKDNPNLEDFKDCNCLGAHISRVWVEID